MHVTNLSSKVPIYWYRKINVGDPYLMRQLSLWLLLEAIKDNKHQGGVKQGHVQLRSFSYIITLPSILDLDITEEAILTIGECI